MKTSTLNEEVRGFVEKKQIREALQFMREYFVSAKYYSLEDFIRLIFINRQLVNLRMSELNDLISNEQKILEETEMCQEIIELKNSVIEEDRELRQSKNGNISDSRWLVIASPNLKKGVELLNLQDQILSLVEELSKKENELERSKVTNEELFEEIKGQKEKLKTLKTKYEKIFNVYLESVEDKDKVSIDRNQEVHELLKDLCHDLVSNVLSKKRTKLSLEFIDDSIEYIGTYHEEYEEDLLYKQKEWIGQIRILITAMKSEFAGIFRIEGELFDLLMKYLEISMLGNVELKLIDPKSQIDNVFSIILPNLYQGITENRLIKIWILTNRLYLELKMFEQDVKYKISIFGYANDLKAFFHNEVEDQEKRSDFNSVFNSLENTIEHYKWINLQLAGIERKLVDIDDKW